MEFSEIDEFKKEFKRLKKKYISLDEDFSDFKELLLAFPAGNGSKHWNKLKENDERFAFKTRLMCRAVRGATFRVIYFFDAKVGQIVFIEIYYKSQQENENRPRLEAEFVRLCK